MTDTPAAKLNHEVTLGVEFMKVETTRKKDTLRGHTNPGMTIFGFRIYGRKINLPFRWSHAYFFLLLLTDDVTLFKSKSSICAIHI